MAEWGGAIEVDGLPSSASIDELSLLVAQFDDCRRHRILLSSPGASGVGAALVLLPSAATAATVAELLDSHPISGGLLEVQACDDPAGWVQQHVVQVGGGERTCSWPGVSCLPHCRPMAQLKPS